MTCILCNEKINRFLADGFYLIDGSLIEKRNGYHRACELCFKRVMIENPEVKLYSGNPEPWMDRHLVLSKTPIEGIGWISHNRETILKQFKGDCTLCD